VSSEHSSGKLAIARHGKAEKNINGVQAAVPPSSAFTRHSTKAVIADPILRWLNPPKVYPIFDGIVSNLEF
jgi:hypothetical protein